MPDAGVVQWIHAKFEPLRNEWDERARRRWAAVESLSLGWGGISAVSAATGLSPKTIRAGRRELEAKQVTDEPRRIRRAGGRPEETHGTRRPVAAGARSAGRTSDARRSRLLVMKPVAAAVILLAALLSAVSAHEGNSLAGRSPADELPPHIQRITWFGERADWSHDGKRILFLSKTFGDAMEVDLATKTIRNLTAHYRLHGYTRALYLANGDILLSGPRSFDPNKIREARVQCFLSVLDKTLTNPPTPLGVKCFEGPAVSRKRMHIAWTHTGEQSPDVLPSDVSQIRVADIVYDGASPRLANERLALDSRDLPFPCLMKTQNFVPPDEQQLTFSAYGFQGTDAALVDLATKAVANLTDALDQYDEPEGIYPDGEFTLVECDKHDKLGDRHIDLWKLRLDGGGYVERLTYFSDYPGYKASNPVVSDDGSFIAFQLAKSSDEAGVGQGIFLLELK